MDFLILRDSIALPWCTNGNVLDFLIFRDYIALRRCRGFYSLGGLVIS